jgi:histidinol-phosphate aminotransferase
MMLENLAPEYIRKFEPYTPSKPDDVLKRLFGCTHIYRLNNNENALGPPPKAQEMLKTMDPRCAAIYPSGDSYHLKYRLAEKYGLLPDQVLIGNGANEVISFVIKAFCEQGDNIVTADKTFAVYEWVAKFSGCEARLVPLLDFAFDAEGMLAKRDERTKIIFLCNPNNPTGTYWSEDKLRSFLDRVECRQIVVVDEAYCEFVEEKDYPDGILLLRDYPNLIIFRTFSKIYGLAGLRIGYLVGSLDVVNLLRCTCIVYSVNSVAQLAATAALDDDDHLMRTRDMVRAGKKYLTGECERLGLNYQCGQGSFMMIRLPMSDSLAYRRLMKEGIMVRSMTGFRFPDYIRVTISTMDIMEIFAGALSRLLKP